MSEASQKKSKTVAKSRKRPAASKKPATSEKATSSTRQLKSTPRSWKQPRTWHAKTLKPTPLPKARKLLRSTWTHFMSNPRTILGLTAIYGVGMLLLVRGFSAGQDVTTLKTLLDNILTGNGGKAQSTVLQLSFLFSDGNTPSSAEAGVYRMILLVICSLACIWALRQIHARKSAGIKPAFYRGMSPLVPFLLVLAIIGIQLLPFTIASLVYNNLMGAGLAVHLWEKLLVLTLCSLLALWSLRMLTGSIFALYIVTLPDMTPLHALKNARQLVQKRRLQIWRKLLYIMVCVVIFTSIIVIPFLLLLTPLAAWVFFVASTLWFPLVHGYLYQLYRELLG